MTQASGIFERKLLELIEDEYETMTTQFEEGEEEQNSVMLEQQYDAWKKMLEDEEQEMKRLERVETSSRKEDKKQWLQLHAKKRAEEKIEQLEQKKKKVSTATSSTNSIKKVLELEAKKRSEQSHIAKKEKFIKEERKHLLEMEAKENTELSLQNVSLLEVLMDRAVRDIQKVASEPRSSPSSIFRAVWSRSSFASPFFSISSIGQQQQQQRKEETTTTATIISDSFGEFFPLTPPIVVGNNKKEEEKTQQDGSALLDDKVGNNRMYFADSAHERDVSITTTTTNAIDRALLELSKMSTERMYIFFALLFAIVAERMVDHP
jgi:hypothetical protein